MASSLANIAKGGSRHALLLAAGKLVRLVVGAVRQTDELQRVVGAFPLLVRHNAPVIVEHRHLDIFQRRRARKQVEPLENKTELVVADFGALVAVERGNINAVEQITAAGGPVETTDGVHQRALARAAGTHDGDEFAGQNVQRHAAHGVDVHFAGAVNLVDVRELDDRAHWYDE